MAVIHEAIPNSEALHNYEKAVKAENSAFSFLPGSPAHFLFLPVSSTAALDHVSVLDVSNRSPSGRQRNVNLPETTDRSSY